MIEHGHVIESIDGDDLLDLPSTLEKIGLETLECFRVLLDGQVQPVNQVVNQVFISQSQEESTLPKDESSLLAEIQRLKQALKLAEKETQTLREALKTAEKATQAALLEAKKYKDVAMQTEAENERLRAEASKSRDQHDHLQQEVEDLKNELERYRNQSTQTDDVRKNSKDAQVQALLNTCCSKKEKELESLRNKLAEACDRLKKAATARNHERKQREFDRHQFMEIVKSIRRCLAEFKAEMKELETHCHELGDRFGLTTELDDTFRMMKRFHASHQQQERECHRLHALLICHHLPQQQYQCPLRPHSATQIKSGEFTESERDRPKYLAW